MSTSQHDFQGGYRYLFGPVPSRRLGRSLGVDLVPVKTCTFNCPFCEVGLTTAHTVARREYVPVDDVLAEFEDWLASGGEADIITVAGSGEPTLHSRFGDILAGIKACCDIPTALLTNSSLMHLPDVRAGASNASIIKASLSAWDQASFERVNQAHSSLSFETMVEGLRALRGVYSARIWMEVFLMAGVNDDPADVQKIADLAKGIRPDRVQLNTVVRPPADGQAGAVGPEALQKLAGLFEPHAELIAGFQGEPCCGATATEAEVVNMLARRPCTAADVAASFGLPQNESEVLLDQLCESGRVVSDARHDGIYYLAKS
ncbi:MAG: radical SAM protein [Kiritimatiellae bacterium]|nr:radical SAM protein [Kiritimatiellia bacterium]